MIEQKWLSVSDLSDPAFQVDGKPPPPTIQYMPGNLHEIVDRAEEALIAADIGLYQRSSFIVRPGVVRASAAQEHEGDRRIIPQGDRAIAEAMTQAARWRGSTDDRTTGSASTRRSRSRRPTAATGTLEDPGADRAAERADAARGRFDPRSVRVRQDDRLLAGYRPESLSDYPKTADGRSGACSARPSCRIDRGIPFVGNVDRSVALSAILTAVIRRSLPTAPLHAFDAPVAGSGKSKLVDIAGMIAMGRTPAVIAQGSTEEELENAPGRHAAGGRGGGADRQLRGSARRRLPLQMLTQPTMRMRILGRSETPVLSTASLVTATGNNLAVVGDMTRRTVLCRLDPGCERPELRRFSRNPIATLQQERPAHLVAALTVLRAFHVAGRPRQADPLGSFEDWSDWVRGALIWVGEDDPVASIEAIRADDPKLSAIQAVIAQWREVLGERRVGVRAVIDAATQHRTPLGPTNHKPEFVHPDFREALLAVAGGRRSSQRATAWDLARSAGRSNCWALPPGTRRRSRWLHAVGAEKGREGSEQCSLIDGATTRMLALP